MTIEVQSGKIRLQANLKLVVEAPSIELVENSTHPFVFGDNLLQYLNQIVQIYNTNFKSWHPDNYISPHAAGNTGIAFIQSNNRIKFSAMQLKARTIDSFEIIQQEYCSWREVSCMFVLECEIK